MVDIAPSRRRDRVRAATSQEIIDTARRLLLASGGEAISLRAIAREMGMTAPAIYRYFDSHESLIHHVVADIFTELSDYIEAEIGAAAAAAGGAPAGGAPAGGTPAESAARLTAVQLVAACQAFRGWAVAHPAEFAMIFGSPLPGVDLYRHDPLADCGLRFGGIFLRLVTELWHLQPFDVPAPEEISPGLRPQLASYGEQLGTDLPIGVLQTFLRCWVQLYGTVSLEVFGHLRFALEDSSGMFELMLADLAAALGLQYPPPG